MRRLGTMLRFTIATATVMVAIVIIYGALQADDELGNRATQVATSTIDGWLPGTTTVDAWPTPLPKIPAVSVGALFFQVRGGENPCRYLHTNNRVGAFADVEIDMEFIAGTHDRASLVATGEMHLYGDTGPHLFEIEDADGTVITTVPVDRGATVHETVVFPGTGLYTLHDRLYAYPGYVSEIFARPIGDPGYIPVTGWCP